MLYGRVVHAPRLGARLGRVDASVARAVPGVVEVSIDQRRARVGLVSDDPFVLERAVAALAIEWQGGEQRNDAEMLAELDVERARERDDFEHTVVSDGDPEEAAGAAAQRLDAHYDTSLMAHAAMVPCL